MEQDEESDIQDTVSQKILLPKFILTSKSVTRIVEEESQDSIGKVFYIADTNRVFRQLGQSFFVGLLVFFVFILC